MRRAILAIAALSVLAGCTKKIPNTEIDDTPENRAIVAVVDAYRKAMDRRDAVGVLALVSRAYFDDAGTADPTDDVDYDRLAQQLPATLQKITAERLELGVTQISMESDGTNATVRLFFDNYYRIVTPRAEIPKRDSDVHLMKMRREEGGVWRIASGL
jgi:hypothetical protein